MAVDTLTARWFSEADAAAWDECVRRSPNATFQHLRGYMTYHRERFVDRSVVLVAEGRLIAVFPAASHTHAPDIVVSHPGLSFGGLLLSESARSFTMGMLLQETLRLLKSEGFSSLIYKAVPGIYHRVPAQEDLWWLWREGGSSECRELASTVDLSSPLRLAKGRRSMLAKARQAELKVLQGQEQLPRIWELLEANLQQRHNAKPVHDLSEIMMLSAAFPNGIECLLAENNCGDALAGAVLYVCDRVVHAQYLSSSAQGMQVGALDFLIEHAIMRARAAGARYFDFGISTTDSGRSLNQGLHSYKRGFGAGTTVNERIALDLTSWPDAVGQASE